MLMNRIGDFGLALGIMGVFIVFKSVDYATVFALAPSLVDEKITFLNMDFNAFNCLCILLFVGSVVNQFCQSDLSVLSVLSV